MSFGSMTMKSPGASPTPRLSVSVPKASVKVQVTNGIAALSDEVDWQFKPDGAESGVRFSTHKQPR
jgi:hypothetical protein